MLLNHTDNVTEKAPFILLVRKNRRGKKCLLASRQSGILNKDVSFKRQQGMQTHRPGIIRTLQRVRYQHRLVSRILLLSLPVRLHFQAHGD